MAHGKDSLYNNSSYHENFVVLCRMWPKTKLGGQRQHTSLCGHFEFTDSLLDMDGKNSDLIKFWARVWPRL